jgi:hypothetical protein
LVAVGSKSLPQKTIYPVCRDNFTNLGRFTKDGSHPQFGNAPVTTFGQLRACGGLARFVEWPDGS